MPMKFDKIKELYWTVSVALVTFVIGLLLFGTTLWDGEPTDLQLHDSYFVFSKWSSLAVVFAILLTIVYGCRAVFGRTSAVFKVIAVMLVVVVFGGLITVVSQLNQTLQVETVKAMQQLRRGVGFSPLNYSALEYTIAYDTLAVDSFRVVLIVCRGARSEFVGAGDVWIRCLVGDNITEKYIGPLEAEAGVWIPDPQPIPGMFMAVQCGEYDGVINLVGEHGEFISFPGRRYVVDQENRMYTGFAEYDTLVYEYDLKNGSGKSLVGKHMVWSDLTLRGGSENSGGYWVK